MIRCISVGSASPAKHGKPFTHWPISTHLMETAPQCRPVWAHSRGLMMRRPLANCCVLAARWNVNGSTCACKLHRGATQLTAPRVYLGHNINIWMCAGGPRCGAAPEHINFLSFQCFPGWGAAVRYGHLHPGAARITEIWRGSIVRKIIAIDDYVVVLLFYPFLYSAIVNE